MEHEGSLPCSQEPVTWPKAELDKITLQPLVAFKMHFNIILLSAPLPCDIFPSDFSTVSLYEIFPYTCTNIRNFVWSLWIYINLSQKKKNCCQVTKDLGWGLTRSLHIPHEQNSCASACKTNITQNQPHQISNTQRTENKTTDVVIHQHSRKLLMMDILMSETCWAPNKWNKIASDIELVFHSSTS